MNNNSIDEELCVFFISFCLACFTAFAFFLILHSVHETNYTRPALGEKSDIVYIAEHALFFLKVLE